MRSSKRIAELEVRGRRLPAGQYLTTGFPVLSYGSTPRFHPEKWDFRVFGLVETPLRLNYQQVRALPMSRQVSDFHCVTTWSRFDNAWEGLRISELLKPVKIKPDARFVVIHCDGGYSTNLPLKEFFDDDVMLAYRQDGRELEPDHGCPLRLVVPKLYGWKSAKWVRAIEFRIRDQRGFWEVRGYHSHGDPWAEERYSFEEDAE
ncbi:MAG: sulfite oxidase-like oxidoreductase [Candidatus Binataceae bacterium]